MERQSTLQCPLTDLKGIGEKTAALFREAGPRTVSELLRYYPRDYEIFEPSAPIDTLTADTLVTVTAAVIGTPYVHSVRGRTILNAEVGDVTGRVRCTWFHAPYLKNLLKTGQTYVFRGMLRLHKGTKYLQQPRFYAPEDYLSLSGTMQPRYPLVKGLTNNTVVKAMQRALERAGAEEETLPEEIRKKEALTDIKSALYAIHFPPDKEAFLAARRRLAFEEFYTFLLRLRALREGHEEESNDFPCIEHAACTRLIESLPYALTKAQLRVIEEIKNDMTGTHRMMRMIQGDVGSGKTIVAFYALLLAAANGYQAAIMAPSTVLAAQHHETFSLLAQNYGLPVKPVLLTGALSAKEKREAQEQIASGEVNVIVGTHALFQEKVAYRNLALVVTDEQHRFGVRQREALEEKTEQTGKPHVLSMSATPIPRSLAIILYGDLSVSLLDEMPAERVRIKNAVVDVSFREKARQMILKEVAAGRQAYIVCPMIEASDMEGVQNVEDYAEELRAVFPPTVRIGVLHGQMKGRDKDRVMEDFQERRIDVLVTTTVIEVGVNVPNATVMMIEDAQRFGLAQLHQLRGRVGRSDLQSYCIFVDTSPGMKKDGESARLRIMKESVDGFAIAEEDLRQRGPGDLFGIRQSGDLVFRIADIYRDADLLTKAAAYVQRSV